MRVMDRHIIQQLYNECAVIRAKSKWYHPLMTASSHLPADYLPRQRLWHLVHDQIEPPTCKMCNNLVKWDSAQPVAKQRYRTYCSRKCEHNDPDIKEAKKRSELERYGKGRASVVAKTEATNLQRYGSRYAIQQDAYKSKQIGTVQERYGVNNVSQTPNFLSTRESTMYDTYGVRSYAQLHLEESVREKVNDQEWLHTEHVINKKSIATIAEELGVNGEVVSRALRHYSIPVTFSPTDSAPENQLVQYVQSITTDIIVGDRSIIAPKHLDIFIPTKNLAIEFNGTYWHSELCGRDSRYHINKTEACLSRGVQLIHISDVDWAQKRYIVESMIANKLGSTGTRYYARKCSVEIIPYKRAATFLETNHLQGASKSSVNIGLVSKGDLLCLMTFSKPRYSKNHEWELHRFCNKLDSTVVGGASKLFKHFVAQYAPNSVISYSDRRHSTGHTYHELGFKHTHNSKPSYKYFHKSNATNLLSRVQFQKHKLKELLPTFDESASEWENMRTNGYNRIWDCGNGVWEWVKPTL